MKEILNEYCHQSNQGLLLLSMPTGFGKTYNVLNFIYSNYKKFAAEKRKIIFITNLKKNLPIEELKKRFLEEENEDDFEKYVLFINSNSETVIDNLLALDNEISDDFKKESYSNLKRQVEILSQISRNKQLTKEIKSTFETDIRTKFEPAFRKSIQEKLKENFKTKQARLEAIKNNKDYQWIGQLYPAVFTDEKTVLFLSIDKFLVKNSTLIEDSYDFYNHQPLIKNALIFIDEFDTTKESVLKNIIKSGLENKVDLLGLFSNINNHLMQNESREKLVKESKWQKKQQESSNKKWLSLREQIDSFKEKANKIFNDYKLKHTCKSHENFSTKKRNFLFYDYEFHNVLERYQRIKIIHDLKNRTNWINSVDTKLETTDVDLDKLLREIIGFLTYFQRGIKYLAENFWHLKQEDDKREEAFSLESAVKTVINNFSLDSNSINGKFLVRNIIEINGQYGSKNSKKANNLESLYDFYEKGFCYYDIVDSDEHDTLSKIYMIKFNRTPESFMETIQINSLETKLEMDINGIYLDKPTNLLVNINNDSLKNEDFIEYIFQLEFLRENGDISQNTFKSKLDEVFKKSVGIDKYQKGENLYNTKAYSLYLNKTIIQAIGRICRTNRKSPIIHVLADDSIAKYLNKYHLPEDVIPVREYTALLNSIDESTKESEDLKESQNIASLKSNQTAAYIHTQLNTNWTDDGRVIAR